MKFLLFLGFVADQLLFICLLGFGIKQLLLGQFIDASALICTSVVFQRAWKGKQ